MNHLTKFVFPNTRTCVVRWERNGQFNETIIPTPEGTTGLRNAMLGHRVGYSEIRAVKADPNGVIKDVSTLGRAGALALARAMMRG